MGMSDWNCSLGCQQKGELGKGIGLILYESQKQFGKGNRIGIPFILSDMLIFSLIGSIVVIKHVLFVLN